MRTVFLGTPTFAEISLRALAAGRHRPALVVTQPDRPAGRGRRPQPPEVKRAAEELGIPVIQPRRLRAPDVLARIASERPDVLVVAAFGRILQRELLDVAALGALNVHASLLPRHRGASPIQAAILAGDERVGVSIMKMAEGLDTGDVVARADLPALAGETAGELHDRLAELGAELLVAVLDRIERDGLEAEPQDASQATWAPRLEKSDGLLDLARPAVELERRIRAFTPWPGAFADLRDASGKCVRLQILKASVAEGAGGGRPGEVALPSRSELLVSCGEGALAIQRVRPAGRRDVDVAAFLNGARMEPPLTLTKPSP